MMGGCYYFGQYSTFNSDTMECTLDGIAVDLRANAYEYLWDGLMGFAIADYH